MKYCVMKGGVVLCNRCACICVRCLHCVEVNSGRNSVGWGVWCWGWASLGLCHCGGGVGGV
jgi:hypothetical protein